MPARLIDGKTYASKVKEQVTAGVEAFKAKTGTSPGLAVVLVGEDPASKVYVASKARVSGEVGIRSIEHKLPATTSQDDLLQLVRSLNADPEVNGILVQFPVPDQISQQAVIDTIDPVKDVDGLHPLNAGRLASGLDAMVPCTPYGAYLMLKGVREDLSGLKALVVGRSNLVGKPVAQLLLRENCTVTMAHSRTKDLRAEARAADVLVAAIGKPNFVQGDWVKPGALVIDVGINRIPAPEKGEGKTRLVGDVDFAAASDIAGAITPVPGGVGLMTVACLMRNTLIAAHRQAGLPDPAV
ncbi:Methylenetetrahydrofolate dehydrogenase (NADP+) (EC 1.5.1.5) / Methenyltetrahydrofolate cyclohydrolase (EC 3.5.4.9) [Candidatus Phaeomarinobacter ectocarpi]|uniref:Bifunctional protein FolD n=1 Tax=Candidatus Phaeomarinibacter ectocarpi TaxID=1458461 RepID=X5MLL6_9HYPH|nr:bifunctional methylenetetrahydrofolate dehydrogenase/methenyltetrahydrofolate cyclohydrolase FolD [Candidatus Phaeomarinobacter ectocarpi]CDO59590.1 Methylenetetrahydrofolate dehydrogenase (NADP+) (EC 1.5.1.5) / Methenyltetrahydrofolate cyclohydrolase (EC 3.5.4.9) [Candidatus Phaeomarinobacter ectocarpi]